MRLAFYAPMKSPTHSVPSGDRKIARSLIAALKHMGAEVTLASTLRSRDGKGDESVQHSLQEAAQSEVDRLIPRGRTAGWRAWITYHNYYKAPDLIGPNVSKALGIPYLQIESTRARKRLTGAWASFARSAEAAADAADVVFYFSTRDAVGLRENAAASQHLVHLRPFLPAVSVPQVQASDGAMLSVGMMRAGDKMASFEIIGKTLALLPHDDWHLDIAGDGPARADVEALMAPFGTRLRFLGQLDPDALSTAYQNASLMFWPGVNEALGMVYLEAQAAGLPVLAQDRPGMREVLAPARYPAPDEGPAGLARVLDEMLANPSQRRQSGKAAQDYVAQHHLMPAAASTLRDGLARVGVTL
ncbi:glycosyltransferase family 4 protein [Sulfitobacter geojensis]|uniref:glycosyltransferase family 4 protein n=1 Tax=Sulfitobacter geojensis TaxID=1342299 RepID=UPI003B8CA760